MDHTDSDSLLEYAIFAAAGVPEDVYLAVKKANAEFSQPGDPDGMKAALLRSASALCMAYRGESYVTQFCKVASETPWSPLHDDLFELVVDSFAVGISKSAATTATTLAGQTAKALTSLPFILGGVGGSLFFAANRLVKRENDKAEALKAKIRQYDTITKDLEARLEEKLRAKMHAENLV